MTAITMDNRTNNNISSRNKKKRIFRNVMMIFNILLLIAAVVIAAMVLTGCEKEPESYPEAEALVAAELDKIKTADVAESVLKEFADIAEGEGESLAEIYIEKLKDFDYEILGSQKTEGEDNSVSVRARITTYSFGSVYLDAWTDYMEEEEEWLRSERQLYANMLTRILSLNTKDFIQDVDIVCTDPDGSGKWTTDLKSNEILMNAISGGLLEEMKSIASEEE